MATPAELEAFDAKWSGEAAPQAAPTQTTNAAPNDALTAFDARWSQGGANAPPSTVSATPQLGFQRLYGRHDETGALIPVDEHSGIPMGDYWHIAFQSDPEAKAQALQKLYPDKKVRILDTGDVTLEVMDSRTGKPKDVVINPTGVGAEDLIDLATQTPELAASLATVLATKGRGFLRTVARMVGSAFAGGFTGEVKDVAARAAEGIDVRPELAPCAPDSVT